MEVAAIILGVILSFYLSVGLLLLYHRKAGDNLGKYWGYGWIIQHWKLVMLSFVIVLYAFIMSEIYS